VVALRRADDDLAEELFLLVLADAAGAFLDDEAVQAGQTTKRKESRKK
jgi:hypothetical protein